MAEAAAREEEGEFIIIKSPYGDNIELFDNEEMLSDLLFVYGEEEDTEGLQLHRGILGRGSRLAQGLLKSKEMTESPDANQMGWVFDTKKKVDRDMLVTALRFCYGESMRVGTRDGECCAMIATLSRLQLTCLDKVVTELKAFAISQAEKDARVGAELMVATQDYPECRNVNICELDRDIARVVFTTKNLCDHYEEVVENCLMTLPPEYLDMVDFGEPHTRYSEFNIRLQYVKHKGENMSADDKRKEMNKCDLTKLNGDELGELKKLGIVEPETMKEMYEHALERTESEKRECQEHEKNTEKERSDATKKSLLILSYTFETLSFITC